MANQVNFFSEFKEDYIKLKIRANKGNGEARYLLKLADKGIVKLGARPTAGKKIPRNLWPREYVAKYQITNLWKLNLDSYWRMIYTIAGNEARLISFVIEVMNHKDYDRKFGYHT